MCVVAICTGHYFATTARRIACALKVKVSSGAVPAVGEESSADSGQCAESAADHDQYTITATTA